MTGDQGRGRISGASWSVRSNQSVAEVKVKIKVEIKVEIKVKIKGRALKGAAEVGGSSQRTDAVRTQLDASV